MPDDQQAKKQRRQELFRQLGFDAIMRASADERKVAIEISRWLEREHGLELKSSVVRRWLTSNVGAWQEPRWTIGNLILTWWKDNRHHFEEPRTGLEGEPFDGIDKKAL